MFSGENGIISSPTGGEYPNDVSCAFTIVADGEDHLVQLRFTYFNLSTKTNSSCQEESVQIYDSSGRHHGMFPSTVDNDGKFCGMDSPPVLLSTSRSLTIVFKTRKIDSRRFTAEWKALPKPKGILFDWYSRLLIVALFNIIFCHFPLGNRKEARRFGYQSKRKGIFQKKKKKKFKVKLFCIDISIVYHILLVSLIVYSLL